MTSDTWRQTEPSLIFNEPTRLQPLLPFLTIRDYPNVLLTIRDMRDGSSTGTVDDAALLAGSKKLDDLRNALEGNKETAQIDAMKKVIGYIAKGKYEKTMVSHRVWDSDFLLSSLSKYGFKVD